MYWAIPNGILRNKWFQIMLSNPAGLRCFVTMETRETNDRMDIELVYPTDHQEIAWTVVTANFKIKMRCEGFAHIHT